MILFSASLQRKIGKKKGKMYTIGVPPNVKDIGAHKIALQWLDEEKKNNNNTRWQSQ